MTTNEAVVMLCLFVVVLGLFVVIFIFFILFLVLMSLCGSSEHLWLFYVSL